MYRIHVLKTKLVGDYLDTPLYKGSDPDESSGLAII